MFNIVSWLELYGVKLSEVEFLEKILSTFDASNIMLKYEQSLEEDNSYQNHDKRQEACKKTW